MPRYFAPCQYAALWRARKPRKGEIRDFVVFESRFGQRVVDREELRFADLLVYGPEFAPRGAPSESRIGFDGQMVCRNMLYAERKGRIERAAQRIAAETRHAEDQIDGDVAESGALRSTDRFGRLRGRVAAVHQFQTVVVERLYADRKAVDARFEQPAEVLGRQVVGIGFERRLFGAGAVEELCGVVQQSPDRFGRAERRRSAAEIAGRHRFAARIAAPVVQFAVHGRQQVVHAPQVGAFVKVAVGADALAEGYVEIESGHGYQS